MFPYINIVGVQIPMYGICMMTGIVVAVLLMLRSCRRENLCWEDALIIVFTGITFGLVGAKALFVFVTYSPAEIFQLIENGKIQTLFQSGLVFYGGLILGVFGAWVGACLVKVHLLEYESVMVPFIPLAHAFGRLGCLFSGCCYGKITDSVFRVIYTKPISDAPKNIGLIPIQGYEALLNVLLFFVLSFLEKRVRKGILLCTYLLFYSVVRFVMEFWRFDAVRGGFGMFSTSQWISLLILTISIIMIVVKKKEI